ncbi:MAG: hypothetical protein AB1673_06580 [Actinomycetota bacterium]
MVGRAALVALALGLGAAGAAVGAAPVAAHEQQAVGGFVLVVGWGQEPAYTGLLNSVQVRITEAGSGAAVTDVAGTLNVEVVKGEDRVTMPMVPNFGTSSGTPGDYRAWLTPTRPGSYTFRFTGTIRGQSVDESFTSSSTTFDDVVDATETHFPARDPSTGQIATRIDREVPRLEARADEVEAALAAADDRVRSARALAVAGLALGGLGALAAGAALVSARRSRTAPPGRPAAGNDASRGAGATGAARSRTP